ncbi:MAG: lamin tail domain-containing protein [Ardenticatenaceae bacterium]|nr:lamin tail domain-containing protein [Anaerolineales bacterium]MCB8982972.1 lamin tail domain-containing protein [Ardenticatenaceae bacterium]MCB8986428.1 lamin tail domain-containing protein [Ardenticatenaceae bacterium]
MSFRRMVPFLLLNVLVSAAVVLAILYWWDGRDNGTEPIAAATATAVIPTPDINLRSGEEAALTAEEAAGTTGEETAVNDGPTTHTVQAGETLGSISTRYEVSIEDIMAANGIDNPNFLSIGQELIIPIGGLATPTAVPTDTPQPGIPPTPIPTEAASDQGEADVQIGEVAGPGDLAAEAVQIVNSGTRQIGLAGWKISDESGFVYTFGQVTLFGEGAGILIHTETGANGPTDLYWGLESPVWESGETVTLTDASGSVQDTYTIP